MRYALAFFRRIAGGIFAIGLIAMAACNSDAPRARQYFHISDLEPVNKTTIRNAVLRDVPIGSSEERVRSFLVERRIGADARTFVDRPDASRIIAEVQPGPERLLHIRSDYVVFFYLDSAQRVRDIQVREYIAS